MPNPACVAEIVESHLPAALPHVPGVEKHDAPELADERGPELGAPLEQAVAADRQSGTERTHLVAAPSPHGRRPSKEVLLGERDVSRFVGGGIDGGNLKTIGDNDSSADRHVVPRVSRQGKVAKGAGQKPAGVLRMQRDLIPAARVEHAVGGRMVHVDGNRVQRAFLFPSGRIQTDGNEIVAQRRIIEGGFGNGAARKLAQDRYRQGRVRKAPPCHRHLAARDGRTRTPGSS